MKKNEERLLRAHIRSAIKLATRKKYITLQNEVKFRKLLKHLILEVAAEKVETDPHEYTGINVLRELFKNTNILKTLRQSYKTLTTNPEQRKSFRAHILNWVMDTLDPIQATDQATLNEEVVDIDVISDDDKDKFINADDGSDQDSEFIDKAEKDAEEPEETEEEGFRELPDQDTTGRNKADQVYSVIETSIVDAFSSLDDPKDQEIFKRWIVANLKLYFDKWEKELDPSLSEPSSSEYEEAKEDTPIPAEEEGAQPPEEAPEEAPIGMEGDENEEEVPAGAPTPKLPDLPPGV